MDTIVDEDGFGPADLARILPLDGGMLEDLARYRALLAEENTRMNLVGPSALAQFWRRHALDSAQLLEHAPGALLWADLGSGAGFPGLVLAVRLKRVGGARLHLVESQAKRCRFLRSVSEALDLPVQVTWARAEAADIPPVDIVTARAVAPLARLFGYALPYVKRGARALFLKGRTVEDEIAEATASWRFKSAVSPSLSDPEGRIVSVEGLARA